MYIHRDSKLIVRRAPNKMRVRLPAGFARRSYATQCEVFSPATRAACSIAFFSHIATREMFADVTKRIDCVPFAMKVPS